MAITIPKRPSREPTPGFDRPPKRSVDTQVSSALSGLGRVMSDHSKRIQAQHDVATSQTAVRDFRDRARTEMTDHLSREGVHAKGSLGQHKQWFDEESGKIENSLDNDVQKQLFRSSLDPIRNRDLDQLAGHQAKQHKARLQGNLKGQAADAEKEVTLNAHSNTVKEQMGLLKDSYATLYPGVDKSAELHEERVKLEVIALKTLSVLDPNYAVLLLDEWQGDLGDQYDATRDIVYKEYLHQEAANKFPDDFDAQREFINDFPDIPTNVSSYAKNRVNAREAEIVSKATTEYAELYGATQDNVSGLIRTGGYDEAMRTIASTPGLRDTEKLNLERTVQAAANGKGDRFAVSDNDFVAKQIDLALSGKLPSHLIVPIPGKLSITHAGTIRGIAERVEKEASGNAKPEESRARAATQNIVKDMELDGREEALMIGNKLNQLDRYIKTNPGADYMKYVDNELLANEKGWAITKWINRAEEALKFFPGPASAVEGAISMAGRVDRFLQSQDEVEDSREQAIQELNNLGQPVTEKNIQNAIGQLNGN